MESVRNQESIRAGQLVAQNEANNAPNIVRIKKELGRLLREPVQNISTRPVQDDLFHWTATIIGPNGTPYEGGVFHLDILFPANYPQSQPKIRFLNKVFHPNVAPAGQVCENVQNWSLALQARGFLLVISALLADPDLESPVCVEAAELYMKDRQRFFEVAREWTEKYASKD